MHTVHRCNRLTCCSLYPPTLDSTYRPVLSPSPIAPDKWMWKCRMFNFTLAAYFVAQQRHAWRRLNCSRSRTESRSRHRYTNISTECGTIALFPKTLTTRFWDVMWTEVVQETMAISTNCWKYLVMVFNVLFAVSTGLFLIQQISLFPLSDSHSFPLGLSALSYLHKKDHCSVIEISVSVAL